MKKMTIAGLEVLVKEGAAGGPVIVLLHGYGADNADLASLADLLPVPAGTTWVFPNAPLTVPLGPHAQGRAWFPLDVAALEEAMQHGTHRSYAAGMPEGMAAAAAQVSRLVEGLGRDPSETILGGFSQGAMIACEVALTQAAAPHGLLLLSSALVAQARWSEAMARYAGLRVFLSHGRVDPLLSYADAETLRDLFVQSGATVDFVPFAGGHEIPPVVMQGLARFLAG